MASEPLRLVAVLNHRVVSNRTYDQDRITIGRGSDCDIHLDNMALSRLHAEILRGAWGWLLRDPGSRNGVYVNGKQVSQHKLVSGDQLVVGKFTLTCELPNSSPGSSGNWKVEGKALQQGRTVPVEEEAPEPELPEAHLLLTDASRKMVPLRRPVVHVGRGAECSLKLGGLTSPRRLATIVRGASGYTLLNVSPKGEGVFHNGKPVALRATLRDGDRIELGKARARFQLGPARRRV